MNAATKSRNGNFVQVIRTSAIAVVASLCAVFVASPDAAAQGNDSRPAVIDGAEQVRQAASTLDGSKGVHEQLGVELDRAKKRRDVVMSLCLEDNLSQLDNVMSAMRERLASLRQAVAQRDVEVASHQYAILLALSERSQLVEGRARTCIGTNVGRPGEESKRVTVDPLPPDPDDYPLAPLIVEPPHCASCLK